MGTTTLIKHPFSPIKLAWVILFKSTRLEVAAVYCGPKSKPEIRNQITSWEIREIELCIVKLEPPAVNIVLSI